MQRLARTLALPFNLLMCERDVWEPGGEFWMNESVVSSRSGSAGLPRVAGGRLRAGFDFPAAALSGLALAFALSGPGHAWASWVAMVPALVALYRAGPRRAFLLGVCRARYRRRRSGSGWR